MDPKNLKKLQGDARPGTHLARYELADDHRKKTVLDVKCPYCAAPPGAQCYAGS